MSFTTIHFDASDYCGTDFDARRVKLWATNNAEDQTIHDPDGHVYIGSGNGTIAADGQAAITVPVPETGWNPITCQTTLHLDYPDRNSPTRRGRETKTFGPFTVPEGSIAGLITNVALTSNVASLTTSAAHGLRVGYTVTISGDSAPFNGEHVITEVTSTVTFKAVIVATDVTSRAAAALFSSNDVQLNDLVEEQTVPPTYLSQVTAALDAKVAEAEAAAASAQAIVTADLDTATAALVPDTGTATGAALSATIGAEVAARDAGQGVARFISRAQAGATLKVVGIGDSILAGTGATVGVNDTLTRLIEALAVTYPDATITQQNRAVSGSTTALAGIGGTFDTALTDAGDLYVIGFGRNDVQADAYPGQPVQGYAKERSLRYLEVMIRAIRADVPQADILLYTENPPTSYAGDSLMRAYQAGVMALGKAYGCEVADTYAAWGTSGYSALLSDGVHPSPAGHQLHADTMAARFPASLPEGKPGKSAPALPKGMRTPEAVDTTEGFHGWTVINGSAPTADYVQTGAGWSGTYPRTTTTATDYFEVTFTGTDIAVRFDQTAGAAPVVDIAIDGVTTHTNQSLYVVPSAFQLFQFLATDLADDEHTLRVTLKSGTLRWYQIASLAGAPTVSIAGEPAGLRVMKPTAYYTQQRFGAGGVSSVVTFLNSGDAYAVPIWVPKATSFDRIAVEVTQAAAGSTITLGIYESDQYDQPAARIASASALNTSTAGFKQSTLTGVTLQEGWYWLGMVALGGFAASSLRVRGSDLSHPLVVTTATTMANVFSAYLDAGESALPSTWVSGLAAGLGPLIALRAA